MRRKLHGELVKRGECMSRLQWHVKHFETWACKHRYLAAALYTFCIACVMIIPIWIIYPDLMAAFVVTYGGLILATIVLTIIIEMIILVTKKS